MKKNDQGFGLVELLVALSIFSIGFLALLQLQLRSIRLSQDNLHQAIAHIHALDMAHRIRANQGEAMLGVASGYHLSQGSATPHRTCHGLNPEGLEDNVFCSGAQLASDDVFSWQALLVGDQGNTWLPPSGALLPHATGVVCVDSSPEDGTPEAPACDGLTVDNVPIYAIKIWWRNRTYDDAESRFVMGITP